MLKWLTVNKKQRLKKFFYYSFLAKLSLLTLLAIGYFTPVINCNIKQEKCDFSVCVINDGMHTNIVLPVSNNLVDWREFINISTMGKDTTANYKYLTFGWGDRDFYIQTPTFAELNLVTAFKALFLPTPSTILVQGFSHIPQNRETKCVKVTKTNYLQLTQFIQNTFELNLQNQPIRIADGHLSSSGFYAAKGSYSIVRTCNNWTAEALRKANVDTPLWAGLSSAVMLHFRRSCECSIKL
ncbi:DUF2459 domain-containing protein [Phormidium sp. LEGE 05292]|uniref:DUF2459 domain-containing protein n=1 Tax=[Phormidium] sp. LEGE 05292 TaxID=767427 RepID=UPI00187DFFE4|nr:DUF2459 domain-containing protein [Phormidium sp. LEGE 05292]MBE9229089.1 DUF2459 domain-containing protein [Phormidium sp. LEGE 05292]